MFSEYSSIQKDRMHLILKAILNHKRITRNSLAKFLRLNPKNLIDLGLIQETDQE